MAPEDQLGILEPKVSIAFELPKPNVNLLGSTRGRLLGLECERGFQKGNTIWDMKTASPGEHLPVDIYNRLWEVDGKSVVMEYCWLTGGVLRDLETAEPIFILTTDHQAIVDPEPEKVYHTNEMINEIHHVGNRHLVENFRHGHFSDQEHVRLYDLKTGELVVKRKDIIQVQTLDDTIIGLHKDGNYYDLLTEAKVFEAAPDYASSGIVKVNDSYLVNCEHNVYDIKERRVIRPLPPRAPDNFDVQLVEGRPVVYGTDRPVYYDILLGEVAFSLPFKGYLQILDGRYFVLSEEQPEERTIIHEVTFAKRRVN